MCRSHTSNGTVAQVHAAMFIYADASPLLNVWGVVLRSSCGQPLCTLSDICTSASPAAHYNCLARHGCLLPSLLEPERWLRAFHDISCVTGTETCKASKTSSRIKVLIRDLAESEQAGKRVQASAGEARASSFFKATASARPSKRGITLLV